MTSRPCADEVSEEGLTRRRPITGGVHDLARLMRRGFDRLVAGRSYDHRSLLRPRSAFPLNTKIIPSSIVALLLVAFGYSHSGFHEVQAKRDLHLV